MKSPYFTVVMPHYHKSIPHDRFIRAVQSIKFQSFQDWELLIYHDGPIEDPNLLGFREEIIKDPRINFSVDPKRHNDWGHSLRDKGIRAANGTYIINTNSDNTFTQNAFAIFYAYSKWKSREINYRSRAENSIVKFMINPDCLIFGIKMMGMVNVSNQHFKIRIPGEESVFQTVFPGWPPNKYNIDAMQLVAKRYIWEKFGFWAEKGEESDGEIIQKITSTLGYLVIPEVLGEHW